MYAKLGSLLLGALLGSQTASAKTIVLPFSFFPENLSVGNVKYGMICLPGGKLRWKDLAIPSSESVTDLIVNRSKAVDDVVSSNVNPWQFAADNTNYLRGTLTDLKMNVCVPYLGIGESRSKGTGTVRVHWKLVDNEGNEKLDETLTESFSVIGIDPRKDGSNLASAIANSAVIFLQKQSNLRGD